MVESKKSIYDEQEEVPPPLVPAATPNEEEDDDDGEADTSYPLPTNLQDGGKQTEGGTWQT